MTLARIGVALAALALSACGAADDPHPLAVGSGRVMSMESEIEIQCTPGDLRACHRYYVDADGQQQCPLSVQECNDAGDEWLPCGALGITGDAGLAR